MRFIARRPLLLFTFLFLAGSLGYAQAWVDTTYQIATELDLAYGTAITFSGREDTLKFDLSYPEGEDGPECGWPLVVIVHGGAWFAGDKNEGYPRRLRQDFAKRGYVAASVNYRLGVFQTDRFINCNVPEWNCFNTADTSEFYRANYRAVQDVHGAIRYLIGKQEGYNINPDNVFLIGESAGGFVAMGVGFMDDTTEVSATLVGEYPAALAPNALYESPCILKYDLANSITEMNLSRPALGSYAGTLNLPAKDYTLKAVGNIYGGAFGNIFRQYGDQAPALYLYHQPCDLIAPFNQGKLLAGYNNCLLGFPTNCANIINRPFVYGSRGIKRLIDSLAANNLPTADYYFDNSGNSFNCFQQAVDPNAGCHSIDNYWLRTNNMANYFAGFVDSCKINTAVNGQVDPFGRFKIYPNPVHDFLVLDFGGEVNALTVDVFNVLGARKSTHRFAKQVQGKIDMADLPAGTYYLLLQADERRLSQRVIRQ